MVAPLSAVNGFGRLRKRVGQLRYSACYSLLHALYACAAEIVATSADTDSAESSNSEDSYLVQSDNDRQGNCSTKA